MPSKVTSSSPQRFKDYLGCLQEEFDNATLTNSSGPRPFNIYLANLQGEFELMALQTESLQKEKCDLEAKAQEQAKQLQNIRNVLCEPCKGIISPPTTASSLLKTSDTPSLPSSKPVPQPKALHIPSVPLQAVNSSQQTPRPPMILTPTPQSADTISQSVPDNDSQSVSRVSPLPHGSPSARGWSITFNDKVKKELDVEPIHVLFHKRRIRCVKFSQDGKYLAAACKDGRAYVYDVPTGTVTCVLRNLLTDKDYIRALCFSPDGKYLATASTDGKIYIWEINTKYVRNAFKGHTHYIPYLDFSPNGRLIASPHGNVVQLWNLRCGATKFLVEHNPTFIDKPSYSSTVFSPDGNYVAASHRDGVVRIWGIRTTTLLRRVMAHVDWVFDVALMPDGKGMLCGGTDTSLSYWDIGALYTTAGSDNFPREVKEQTRPDRRFSGHTGSVCSIAVSPDGKWVASGSRDQSVRIWDSSNAEVQCVLKNVHKEVWTVDFSPAGSYFASGGYDGLVRIWKYSQRNIR